VSVLNSRVSSFRSVHTVLMLCAYAPIFLSGADGPRRPESEERSVPSNAECDRSCSESGFFCGRSSLLGPGLLSCCVAVGAGWEHCWRMFLQQLLN